MDEAQPPSDRRRIRFIAAAIAVVLLVVGGWLMSPLWIATPIPDIDHAGVHAEVAVGIDAARDLVRQHPDSGPTWGALGLTLWAHEYNLEALECFRQATTLDASESRWPYFAGHILYADDRDAARMAFEEAVRRDRTNSLLRVRLAEALMDAGDIAAAEEHLRAAFEADNADPRSNLRLSQWLQMTGDMKQALLHANLAWKSAPDHRGVLMQLSRLLAAAGQPDGAAEVAQRLQTTKGDTGWPDQLVAEKQSFRLDPYWTVFRAEQALASGASETGTDLLVRLVEKHPDSPVFRVRLVRAQMAAGRAAEAKAILEAAPVSVQSNFELRTLRAVLHLLSEEWTDGEAIYQELLQQKPDSVALRLDLAFVLRQQKRYGDALRMVDQAVSLEPDNTVARAERIRIRFAAGDEAWRAEFEELQHSAPDSRDVRLLLEELFDE